MLPSSHSLTTTTRRWLILSTWALVGGAAIALYSACTTHEALGQAGTACVDDGQCVTPLACLCIRKLTGDEEGTDHVLQNGFCAVAGTHCPADGGVAESGPSGDAGAESSSPDASDASGTAVDGDAGDAGGDADAGDVHD